MERTFFREFLDEASFRMFLAVGAMALALVVAVVGAWWHGDAGQLGGLILGLAVGIAVGVVFHRRREQRLVQRN